MMIQFSERAGAALIRSYQTAKSYQVDYIGTEHLLLGIVKEEEGAAFEALTGFGLDSNKLVTAVSQISRKEPVEVEPDDSLSVEKIVGMFTPRTQHVVQLAVQESRKLTQTVLEPEHLLLGILREGECVASRILVGTGVDVRRLFAMVVEALQATGRQEETGDESRDRKSVV